MSLARIGPAPREAAGTLIVGRAQQAALAGDVATAADLLDYAVSALLQSGQSTSAARALLDLAQLADELGEPVRRRRAVERAREALARAEDRTESVQAAEILLGAGLAQSGTLGEAISRSRTLLS